MRAEERPTAAADREAHTASVLVAYASDHGATRGVAERIAARLGDRHLDVDLRAIAELDGELSSYDAVVLGSAVYEQSWLPAATEFLRAHAGALAGRSVWLFSVDSVEDTHRVVGRMMRREPRDIGQIQAEVHPIDYRVFAGAVESEQRPWIRRVFFRRFGGRFGDDRDWTVIDDWADAIAQWLSDEER